MSLGDRVLRFNFLTGMLLFCLPPPSCFLNVCLPTLLAAVLKFFFPLTISATSATANSDKSAPTRFAAGTIYFLKKGMAVLPITCAIALKPRPLWRPILCSREVQDCLMQPFYTLILIQMNVRNFSIHENNSICSHRDIGNFLTRGVSQIIVYAVKRGFRQSSKLKVATGLIVHVLSSSIYVTRFELGYKLKATEQRRFCVSNNIVLYNVKVNNEWMDANNIVSKCWFMRTFTTHEYSRIISHISSKYMSQVSTKKCKTRFFIRQIQLYFLRYPANFDCDASVSVVASFLYESIHSFHNVSYGGIQSGFKIVSLCCFEESLVVKHKFPLCNVLVHWWVRSLGNCYLPLSIQIHLLRQEFCKWTESVVWKELRKFVGNQLNSKWIHTQLTLISSFS